MISKKEGSYKELVKDCQKKIEQFREENEFWKLEREGYRRRRIEGESFLWLVPTDDIPQCCYVEPDYIRPSQKHGDKSNMEDPHVSGLGQEDWSFGIHTAKHNYHKPLAYNIVWNTPFDEQIVPADCMTHGAVKERGNIKRGVPPMLRLTDDFIRLTLLRSALAESSKFRASIAGSIEYEQASLNEIRDWESTIKSNFYDVDESLDSFVHSLKLEQYSNLLSLPAGRHFVTGPAGPDAGSLKLIYDWHIESIASSEGLPPWLVNATSDNDSFASSLTTESAQVKTFETDQQESCELSRKVYRKALALMYSQDILTKVDIIVEPESTLTRDGKSEAETHVLLCKSGLESLTTARAILGLDAEEEEKLIKEEKERGIGMEAIGDTVTGKPKSIDAQRQDAEGDKKEQ